MILNNPGRASALYGVRGEFGHVEVSGWQVRGMVILTGGDGMVGWFRGICRSRFFIDIAELSVQKFDAGPEL